MSGFRDYLRGISVLISDVAACVMVLSLAPVFPDISYVRIPVLVWVIFLMVQLLVNLILTWRSVSVNMYLIWNTAATAFLAYLAGRGAVCPEGMGTFAVLTALCAMCTAIHGAYAAWVLPGANGILHYVDGLVVGLAFYLYAAFDAGEWTLNQDAAILAGAAILVNLLAVNQIRTNEESVNIIRGAGAGSKLVLGVIVAGILGLTGAVTGFASGQIHSAVDFLLWLCLIAAKVLEVVFTAIGTVLGWLILLIVLLFPATPQSARENVQTMVQENIEELVEESGFTLPLWFWQLLGIAALVVIASWILRYFRGVRIGRPRRAGKKRRVVRKSHVLSELLRLGRCLRERLIFEFRYRKYRRTPAGLLVYADRLGRRVKDPEAGRRENLGRRKTESPGEYLRRLAGCARREAAEEPELAEGLRGLATLMDEMYYHGKNPGFSREECLRYEELLRRSMGCNS